MTGMVHFSIDDVLSSLKYLTEHERDFSSIWEMDFFGNLCQFHEKYGVKVTLYLFDESRGFEIKDVPSKYKKDFANAVDWLGFGFHGRNTDINFYRSANTRDFMESFENVDRFAKLMSGRDLSRTSRLHYFEANKTRIDFLKEKGVKTLLSADDDRISYGLSSEQCRYIKENGSAVYDGMRYTNTDVRIENISDIDHALITMKEQLQSKSYLVIFTHEWCFMKNIDIMNRIFREFEKEDITYVLDI